jgi:hypothetical protein
MSIVNKSIFCWLFKLLAHTVICYQPTRGTDSRVAQRKFLDSSSLAYPVIRSRAWSLRDGCTLHGRSMRSEGHSTANRWDATHHGSFRRNRAPSFAEVSPCRRNEVASLITAKIHVNANGLSLSVWRWLHRSGDGYVVSCALVIE